jgi:Na+/H+ antiporter NhaD/arsenite permease-like protein
VSHSVPSDTVDLSPFKFLAGCVVAAMAILALGAVVRLPVMLLGIEVFATVISLFIFGSIRYRLDKNALTYGAALVVGATFWGVWWPGSEMRQRVAVEGVEPLLRTVAYYLFTLPGLDYIVHADTMLFILGLTFFVSVISQTRLLETLSFIILRATGGRLLPTVGAITGLVALSSGILDGVSMIGLTIRTLVIILFLARADRTAVIFSVLISTVVTTVCGMWLAYGEPPNLIMKSNLHPHLDDLFFLRYCAPLAVASYVVVVLSLWRWLRGRQVELGKLDVLDLYAADFRFLQAARHGVVQSPVEFIEDHQDIVGEHKEAMLERLRQGEPLGAALVAEGIRPELRRAVLAAYATGELAETLDRHYVAAARGDAVGADRADDPVEAALAETRNRRSQAQLIGALAFVPFISLLVWHALDHHVRLFWASFAGFAVAFLGIASLPRMRRLALKEARHEYAEYYFLFPLFLSITLLQTAGFFDQLKTLLRLGIDSIGASHVAWIQFSCATFLSAILDNNVVADFAARALTDLDLTLMHYFAMAQIAGYALGGCWTHIGCAQSVVAYAFVQRNIDAHYTPFQWIRLMTPTLLGLFVILTLFVYLEGWLLS